ncbi:snapalysin family zinc-dependent metalloprotease, partial [Streptomyces tanashiensis]
MALAAAGPPVRGAAVEGSNPDFAYYEGNDSRGSYASTDGHG